MIIKLIQSKNNIAFRVLNTLNAQNIIFFFENKTLKYMRVETANVINSIDLVDI